MDQIINYSDNRLLRGCIYCENSADTRDHVPSRCLLDQPFPQNLPVVGCCNSCNQNFSKDEQYFVCLIESVLCGSTKPENIRRPSVAKIMKKFPALRQRIENSKVEMDGQIAFEQDSKRVENVMLKLARGHAAFELSQKCWTEPNHFWCGPLSLLSEETREAFNSLHFQSTAGEVLSRNMQRLMVLHMNQISESGEEQNGAMLVNDWLDVQDGRYRYIAIDDMGSVVIRIVISEYFACEVMWEL